MRRLPRRSVAALGRAEKAWPLPRDIAFRLFVDQYIHLKQRDGGCAETVERWLD